MCICRCTFSCGHVACVPAGLVKELEVLMQEVSDKMDIKCLTNKQTVQSYQAVECTVLVRSLHTLDILSLNNFFELFFSPGIMIAGHTSLMF